MNKSLTPTELLVPSEAPGKVHRRLVLRNTTDIELLVKLVQNPVKDDSVRLAEKTIHLASNELIEVKLEIALGIAGYLPDPHQIRGYVKVNSTTRSNGEEWLKTVGVEDKYQLAFTLNIRQTRRFSALDTVIDLPGHAVLLGRTIGRFGIDDMNTTDAVTIVADTKTAKAIGSMENIVEQLRKDGKGWLASLPSLGGSKTDDGNGCWLINKCFGVEKKKEIFKYHGTQTPSCSVYLEPELNPTPAGA